MFIFGGGVQGMGGGAGAGGGMLRTVSRAVTRAGVNLQDPLSSSSSTTSSTTNKVTSPRSKPANNKSASSPNNNLLVSSGGSSPFSGHNNHDLPKSANNGYDWCPFGSAAAYCEDNEWVSVYVNEDGRAYGHGLYEDSVFGPVPSTDEVQTALSALERAFSPPYSQFVRDKYGYNLDNDEAYQISSPAALGHPVYSAGSELDWREPLVPQCNSRTLQHRGYERVHDALDLLQNDPSIKRMATSICLDKSVWASVMNNDVVREVKEFYHPVESSNSEVSDETSDESNDINPAMNFIKWIFDNTKAGFIELFDKITSLVNELFKSPENEKVTKEATTTDLFQQKLQTAFKLSIVVWLVVLVTRAHKSSHRA